MEEEFRCREAGDIGIFDESARTRSIVEFVVMGECAVFETIWDALSIDVLLAHARNHLRNVDERTFGSRVDNHQETVTLAQTFASDFAGLFRRLVQIIIDHIFKLGNVFVGRAVLKRSQVDLVNDGLHLHFLRRNGLDDLVLCRTISNQIANADTKRARFHIFRHNVLEIIVEIGARERAEIVKRSVQNALGRGTEHRFFELTTDIVSIADFQHIVRGLVFFGLFKEFGLVNHGEGWHDLRKNVE